MKILFVVVALLSFAIGVGVLLETLPTSRFWEGILWLWVAVINLLGCVEKE